VRKGYGVVDVNVPKFLTDVDVSALSIMWIADTVLTGHAGTRSSAGRAASKCQTHVGAGGVSLAELPAVSGTIS
jgi:hypothetical protein